jgi:hypothetical protein
MARQPGQSRVETHAAPQLRDQGNGLAMGITVAVLAVMALAIAIDTSSVPGLAFFTVVSLGGLIAAIMVWG